MVSLSHMKFMGILKIFTIIPLGLKVGGGEARRVKVKDASAIFTGRCSCTVIC